MKDVLILIALFSLISTLGAAGAAINGADSTEAMRDYGTIATLAVGFLYVGRERAEK